MGSSETFVYLNVFTACVLDIQETKWMGSK